MIRYLGARPYSIFVVSAKGLNLKRRCSPRRLFTHASPWPRQPDSGFALHFARSNQARRPGIARPLSQRSCATILAVNRYFRARHAGRRAWQVIVVLYLGLTISDSRPPVGQRHRDGISRRKFLANPLPAKLHYPALGTLQLGIPYRVPYPQAMPTQETSPARAVASGRC